MLKLIYIRLKVRILYFLVSHKLINPNIWYKCEINLGRLEGKRLAKLFEIPTTKQDNVRNSDTEKEVDKLNST